MAGGIFREVDGSKKCHLLLRLVYCEWNPVGDSSYKVRDAEVSALLQAEQENDASRHGARIFAGSFGDMTYGGTISALLATLQW